MEDCREKKEEDCRREWRIVGKSGGLLERVEDCRRVEDYRKKWKIVGTSGGLLGKVEDCTLEAQRAGGPLVVYCFKT